ncbi:cation-dependent mannose-6-phosphate receptor-like isoform X2 [Mytilus californianus]|uniref:cation-dependent mannose-6-phosphate receptor-like isoform X2 n=1 Tax=Mytilus californianus TaxID=6549 RepID=UPI0022471D59|nr:cation-dependent mannose-6-phosphate receptor-like isoform X2 [Mytilus californianus]
MKYLQTQNSVFVILLTYISTRVYGQNPAPLCTFKTHKTAQSEMNKRLQPLLGRVFETTDFENLYSYNIGICVNADPQKQFGENVGVVQNLIRDRYPKHGIIGYYNNSQLIEGTDWLILEYLDGQPYANHCGHEPRKARIMITCDNNVKSGEETVKIFEEEIEKTEDCYYLFEISTPDICIKEPPITISLSVGSILVIIFIVVVCLYILLGFLYNRLVLGAKGKEQIPNYSFWQDFGNLQADGCNYICRTGSRSESKPYKGLGDDQLQEEDDRDDHLLPM